MLNQIIATILGAAPAVIALIVHSIRGDNRDSWRSQLTSLAVDLIHNVDLSVGLEAAVTAANLKARNWMISEGVPAALADVLIVEFEARVRAEFSRRVSVAAEIESQLSALADNAETAVTSMRDAEARGLAAGKAMSELVTIDRDAEVTK